MSESSYESLLEVCVASAMSSLRNYTTDQLDELLNSDAKIDAIIDSLPQVRSLPSEREVGITENKTLAEWNLAQESRIEQMRTNVTKLAQQAAIVKNEVEEMKARLDSANGSLTLDLAANLLEVAHREADEDAENLATDFSKGNVPVDLFVQEFHEKKAVAHMRQVKTDRMKSLVNEQYAAQYNPPARHSMPVAPYPDAYPTPAARHAFF